MTNIIAKAGIATLIAIASITATASAASAGGYGGHEQRRHHGHHAGPGFGFGFQFGGPGYYPPPRGCAPMRAVEKARWTGLRRAYVEGVTRHRVIVSGFRHHRFDRMVFANRAGCPTIHR